MGLTRNQSFQLPFLLGLMRTESFQPVALLGLIKGSCWRKCLDRYHRHHHRRPLQEVRHNSHPNTNASGKAGRYDVDAIGACCDRRAKMVGSSSIYQLLNSRRCQSGRKRTVADQRDKQSRFLRSDDWKRELDGAGEMAGHLWHDGLERIYRIRQRWLPRASDTRGCRRWIWKSALGKAA